MGRYDDYALLRLPGQRFQLYVGFGNEIKILVDANNQTPPPTIYPEDLRMVPFRPTVVMGPHRIGFVGEGVPFYGGYSYGRWREVAVGHSWSGTGDPLVQVNLDTTQQTYPGGPQNAFAMFTWSEPGIYEAQLTVADQQGRTHTGKRQVIVYPSRSEAYDGVIGVSGINGGIDQGGWTCQLRARGDHVSPVDRAAAARLGQLGGPLLSGLDGGGRERVVGRVAGMPAHGHEQTALRRDQQQPLAADVRCLERVSASGECRPVWWTRGARSRCEIAAVCADVAA